MPAPATRRVVFGPFELDRASGELRRHGARVRLTGHALTILARLLDEPGAVVSREALRQELWGGGTFVDFEQGLNTAVNRLRQILGDAAERPRYVETVAGRGYRFVAAVESGAATPPTQGISRPRHRAAAVALGASLLAAGAFVGAWWVEASRAGLPRPPVIRFVVEPPAGYALEPATTRQGFDLSPDGRQLVFTARGGDGAFAVFRRDLAEPEPRAVPTAGGAHTVFWAPEGDEIVFAVEGSVRRGRVDGGAHHQLARTNRRFFSGAVLSRETVMMMASRFETLLVPRSGGEVVSEQETCAWPEPLPGGDLLLCLDFAEEPGRNRVRAEHRTTGEKAKVVAETNSRVEYAPSTRSAGLGYLVYVRAGNLVALPVDPRTLEPRGETTPLASGVFHLATSGAADFSLSHGGVLAYMPARGRAQLVLVDRRGRELGRVGPGSSSIYHLGLSPDATRATAAIYDTGFGGPQVWVFDARSGVGARLEDRHSTHAHWSPDASRLAYAAILGTTAPRLVIRSLDGPGAAEYLLPGDREQLLELPTDWSRDGRYVLFEQPLRGDVQIVDLERERRVTPLLHSPASEGGAVFSPDGGRIAYLADRSGVPEVYVQRFEAEPVPRAAGEPVRVSRRGARAVRWPEDGSELFYAGIDGWMYAVPIVETRPGEPEALFEVELEALASMTRSFSFDVAPGGDRFLVARLEPAAPDHIVVIRNWESLLPQ